MDVVAVWLEKKTSRIEGTERQKELERHEKVERDLQAAIVSVMIASAWTLARSTPGSLRI